jgi:hypothetical protein
MPIKSGRKDEMNYRSGIKFLFQTVLSEQSDEDVDDGEAEGLETKSGKSAEIGKVGRAGHFLRVHADPEPGSSEEKTAKKALELRRRAARALGYGTPTGGSDSGRVRTGRR